VPVAESQMKELRAFGRRLRKTGLVREIMRCSGVFHPPLGFPSAVTQEGVVCVHQSFTGYSPTEKRKEKGSGTGPSL